MKKKHQTHQPFISYYPNAAVRVSSSAPAKRRKMWPAARTSLIVVLIAVGAFQFVIKPARAHSSSAARSPEGASSDYLPGQTDLAAMGQKINGVIAAYPSVQISVSVVSVKTSTFYDYGISDGYIAASTAKLITATVFLHEVERGNRSLSETLNGATTKYELQQLIEQSDNDAWQALNDLLGHPTLEQWAHSIGLVGYDATNNILTSKDIALLLLKLYQGKLLNAEHTQLLLAYMQNANEGQYITSSVPPGVKVYHKAGWLDDRVHEAAIIDDGKDPYVLVIFTKVNGTYDQQVGQKIFQALTTATTTAFIKR